MASRWISGLLGVSFALFVKSSGAGAESPFTVPPDTRHRKCPNPQEGFGFTVGDKVTWTGSDPDVNPGEVGRVEELTRDRVKVSFSKGTWDFQPELLKLVSSTLDELPHISIVIPYLNEAWHHIQATVASILWATNMDLVDRILFVDDGNDAENSFKAEIEALHPKVSVHSNGQRLGLIRSKIIGAAETSSPIIFFLEPHCTVNRRWLETILTHMVESPRSTAVMPVLDVMPEDNFSQYRAALPEVGGFDWRMQFIWFQGADVRNSSYVEPDAYASPALSGGIFAIWRSYWESIGTLDAEMLDWGGEHIELSVRIWQCGGRIEVLPCSRIGHMFRSKAPYKMHQPHVERNFKRVIEVWFDEYAERVYEAKPALRAMDAGNVSDRMSLRKSLGCMSMSWYISNVYPELADASNPGGWVDSSDESTELCRNYHPGCPQWAASGECKSNPVFMERKCARSCNLCKSQAHQRKSGDEAADRPDVQESASCQDDHPECEIWAADQKCEEDPGFMQIECRLSCGYCQVASTTASPELSQSSEWTMVTPELYSEL